MAIRAPDGAKKYYLSFSYSRPAKELPSLIFQTLYSSEFPGVLSCVREPALTLEVNPWTFTLIKLERMELAMHSITNLTPMKVGLPTPISFLPIPNEN